MGGAGDALDRRTHGNYEGYAFGTLRQRSLAARSASAACGLGVASELRDERLDRRRTAACRAGARRSRRATRAPYKSPSASNRCASSETPLVAERRTRPEVHHPAERAERRLRRVPRRRRRGGSSFRGDRGATLIVGIAEERDRASRRAPRVPDDRVRRGRAPSAARAQIAARDRAPDGASTRPACPLVARHRRDDLDARSRALRPSARSTSTSPARPRPNPWSCPMSSSRMREAVAQDLVDELLRLVARRARAVNGRTAT